MTHYALTHEVFKRMGIIYFHSLVSLFFYDKKDVILAQTQVFEHKLFLFRV